MGALLAAQSGARLVHIPYRGSAPAVTDLLSGQISSVFLTVAAISSYLDSRHVRALAVTGRERVAALPDVPTFAECGVAGLENPGWFAIFALANLPDEMAAHLREKVQEVMSQPDMQVKLRELGLQDAKLTAATDVQVWDESIVRTREILRRTGLDLN
jgi:tripartite-type tricarboxylate transporter receptor subunit TctC